MINFNTPNAVIVSFPAFSGGKFISNCLALSRHAVFTESSSLNYLLHNPDDYSKRLSVAESSLPPKSEIANWRNYEFTNRNFYGDDFTNWINTGVIDKHYSNPTVEAVSNADIKFFMVDHSGPPTLNNLLRVWPNATVIRLINTRLFQEMCIKLKSDVKSPVDISGNYCIEKYNILSGNNQPTWEEFQASGYNANKFDNLTPFVRDMLTECYPWHTILNKKILFDIDSCIFDSNQFLGAMEELYASLGFDDFNSSSVLKFYKLYISLHY